MKSKVAIVGVVAMLIAACVSAVAQEPAAWQYSKTDDPLHGKTHDNLILHGKYLTPPNIAAPGFSPAIVVTCYDGKVEQNFLAVGAVVNSEILYRTEARMDGKKANFWPESVSTDRQSVFFSRLGLKNLLKSHIAIIGVYEYLGAEVVMQFDMPDSAPVLAACGKDRILKAK